MQHGWVAINGKVRCLSTLDPRQSHMMDVGRGPQPPQTFLFVHQWKASSVGISAQEIR